MIYRLFSDGIERGLIETNASEAIVQKCWNQVYSDVYLFIERRFIESLTSNVTGTKSIEEMILLLKDYNQYSETSRVYEGEEVIDIYSNKIDFI